jgi:L-lysine 6-transaminase
MKKVEIRKLIAGNPAKGVAGLQDDWWTEVAPDIWNSHGSYLRDVSGEEYIDMCGFFATAPVRFDHPKLRDQDFIRKIAKAGLYRPSISDFWTEEMAEFIDTFREVATPSYMHHYFFIDGGSLAVENALKAAFDWKVRMNMKKGKIKGDPAEESQPLGTKVLHFEKAFHGRTGYTLSMTHTADPRKYKYFPKFDWFRVEPPVMAFDCDGKVVNADEVAAQTKAALGQIEKIVGENGDDIAAILIEPIQCEGGDRHIPTDFFKALRKIADDNDIILIYDEVQTGMGTTGKMWAHEHFGPDARPDAICFAKKAQTGGVMANYQRFAMIKENAFGSEPESKSRLNSTWGGNPVDMVRSQAMLEIIRDDKLVENAAKVGGILLKGLQEMCKRYPEAVGNPRGRGMMLAIDARSKNLQGKIYGAFRKNGVLGLTCGVSTLRFRPHLDMTEAEAKEVLDRMDRALGEVKA